MALFPLGFNKTHWTTLLSSVSITLPSTINRILMEKFGQVKINYISHSMHLIQCGFKNHWTEVMSPVSYLALSTLSTISIDDNNLNTFTVESKLRHSFIPFAAVRLNNTQMNVKLSSSLHFKRHFMKKVFSFSISFLMV